MSAPDPGIQAQAQALAKAHKQDCQFGCGTREQRIAAALQQARQQGQEEICAVLEAASEESIRTHRPISEVLRQRFTEAGKLGARGSRAQE